MNISEAIIWAMLALFSLAFVLRLIIGTWKLIYKLAPLVVPLVLMLLFMLANDIPIHEKYRTEGDNADHIESVEDPSRRSGQRNKWDTD